MRSVFLCALLALTCASPQPAPPAPEPVSQLPSTAPAIRGVVTSFRDNVIRVEAEPNVMRGAKAVVTLTSETVVRDARGKTVNRSALREGQKVSVWFGEEVGMSYPIQAQATEIVIE